RRSCPPPSSRATARSRPPPSPPTPRAGSRTAASPAQRTTSRPANRQRSLPPQPKAKPPPSRRLAAARGLAALVDLHQRRHRDAVNDDRDDDTREHERGHRRRGVAREPTVGRVREIEERADAADSEPADERAL